MQGYPGELHVTVTYKLATDKDELTCEITAKPVGEATPGAFLFGAIVCMRKYVCVSVLFWPTLKRSTPNGIGCCVCVYLCMCVCLYSSGQP